MALPQLTHLQFLVVSELLRGAEKGRDLRAALKSDGVRQTSPAFYQMMASLEDAEFVEGWYEQQVIDGQIIRERHYRLLASGRKAWQHSREFYMSTIKATPNLAHGG